MQLIVLLSQLGPISSGKTIPIAGVVPGGGRVVILVGQGRKPARVPVFEMTVLR